MRTPAYIIATLILSLCGLTTKAQMDVDSFRLDFALKDAFKNAKTAFNMDYFSKKYMIFPDDSSYAINVDITIGRLFSDNQKYFLLRRYTAWSVNLDLFRIYEDSTKRLISMEQGGLTYSNDTIFDVNGDGLKDFVVHWYPASGCCRRDIYNVYLYLPDKGVFSKDYQFVNPTFYAEEKIIRGVGYGHPGEVGLYKYEWIGYEVKPIEYIYPDPLIKGQFIRTIKETYEPTEKDGVVLKIIPDEYKNIISFDWFIKY
jgi:hypothetical protein